MEVKELVVDYQPSEFSLKGLQDMKFLFMVGIASAGKDTLQGELLKDDRYEKIITSVTRKPRMNNGIMEQNGREYNFLSYDDALNKLKNHHYIEVALVHGEIYGATVGEMRRIHEMKKIALADVDFQGVEYYQSHFENVSVAAIMPPSYDEWMARARNRYADEDAFRHAWTRRIESAQVELRWMLLRDHPFVVNDDVAEAVQYIKHLEKNGIDHDQQARGRHIAEQILKNIS